jgi:hypothetical protein
MFLSLGVSHDGGQLLRPKSVSRKQEDNFVEMVQFLWVNKDRTSRSLSRSKGVEAKSIRRFIRAKTMPSASDGKQHQSRASTQDQDSALPDLDRRRQKGSSTIHGGQARYQAKWRVRPNPRLKRSAVQARWMRPLGARDMDFSRFKSSKGPSSDLDEDVRLTRDMHRAGRCLPLFW